MRFGSYVQSIHETNPTNTTTPRTICVIYLRALDMLKGGFEVRNLLTRKIISPCKVTPIQITQEVIDRAETFAKKCVIKSPLKFKDYKERTTHDDDDENDDGDVSITGVGNEDE